MRIPALLVMLFALLIPSHAALAGPFQDFEKQARNAYGAYRMALFSTNQKDKAKAVAMIEKFDRQWGVLVKDWSNKTPPQYASDKRFATDLSSVSAITKKSLAEAKSDGLKKSHNSLERIRDILSDLRARNGIVSYSDPVNAYHAHMEQVLLTNYAGKKSALIGDTAVLGYLAKALADRAPTAIRDDAAFKKSHAEVLASIARLRKALAGNDPQAVMKARKQLKKPYAKLFIRWG